MLARLMLNVAGMPLVKRPGAHGVLPSTVASPFVQNCAIPEPCCTSSLNMSVMSVEAATCVAPLAGAYPSTFTAGAVLSVGSGARVPAATTKE